MLLINRGKYILGTALLLKRNIFNFIIIITIIIIPLSYLLQISLVLVSVGIPHVSLLRPGVAEGDQALNTLQTLVQTLLTCTKYINALRTLLTTSHREVAGRVSYGAARGRPPAQT